MAALRVLEGIASSKLPEYVQLAEDDGREYLVNYARRVRL
jgi:hypothetical protein